MRQDSVSPLTRQDGSIATSREDEIAILAKLFADKSEEPPHQAPSSVTKGDHPHHHNGAGGKRTRVTGRGESHGSK